MKLRHTSRLLNQSSHIVLKCNSEAAAPRHGTFFYFLKNQSQSQRRYQTCQRVFSNGNGNLEKSNSDKSIFGQIKELTERFDETHIPESDVSAEYIVAHALGIKQLSELARFDQTRILSPEEIKRVSELAAQKLARMPLQYILGEWEFRDLTLKMKPPVFIPRPETEMLIDLIVGYYDDDEKLSVLEVGCGSGAISISLLKEFKKAKVTAIDATVDAVELTQENARSLELAHRLSVHHCQLTEGALPEPLLAGGYDVIVSNPPYVFSRDMSDLDLEISRYEDPTALEAGPEGMSVITAIVKQARHLLKPGGVIWLETDVRHHKMIEAWLGEHPECCVRFRQSYLDFTDRPRFCRLEYAP